MTIPQKIWLYRITHIDNLPHILRYGLVTEGSPNSNPDFTKIGDGSLIKFRKDLDAPIPPGGKLLDFVPFYLGPRSPMLYQIATGFEDIKKFPQEEIIYLISSLDKIKSHELDYFFTDGHVRSRTSNKYNKESDFEKLDWEVIYSQNWKSDETDLRRKEKKQAELLIKDQVPLSCIEYIGVFNQACRQKILVLLQESNTSIEVKISPEKLYYDHL